jgi:hypothetical protein
MNIDGGKCTIRHRQIPTETLLAKVQWEGLATRDSRLLVPTNSDVRTGDDGVVGPLAGQLLLFRGGAFILAKRTRHLGHVNLARESGVKH